MFRSEKFAASVILLAAVLGFSLANSVIAEPFHAVADAKIGIGYQLPFHYWVSELGLAFFFLLIGIELRHEFTHGTFKKPKNAIPPLLAAVLGVVTPAGLYALVNLGSEGLRGWAIPTATDVTFALAIYLLFGSKLPSRARVFLLTVVVADDLIAIVIIAVLFPVKLDLLALALAVPLAFAFWLVVKSKLVRAIKIPFATLLGLGVWIAFYVSGVHPVIAGVLIGLLLNERQGKQVEHAIWVPTNLLILPLFAAFSAAVSLSAVGTLGTVFFGIMLGPVGKIFGIALGGWIGYRLIQAPRTESLSFGVLARLGALGGIGFTVALLVSQLSFRDSVELASQATFGVLVASVITMILGALALSTAKRT